MTGLALFLISLFDSILNMQVEPRLFGGAEALNGGI